MIEKINISGYRGFESLTIADLRRINLFVGRNNCGKSSILEAVELLTSGQTPAPLVRIADRRGEYITKQDQDVRRRELDVRQLFHGRFLDQGIEFELDGLGKNGTDSLSLRCSVSVPKSDLFSEQGSPSEFSPSLFVINYEHSLGQAVELPLSNDTGMSSDFARRFYPRRDIADRPSTFIKSETLTNNELRSFWDSIALTPEEDTITDMLKILEPNIERIAFLGESLHRYRQEGIYIKIKKVDERVPLGSLGDGIKHLLGISLAISQSKNGYVMIDEIDTGLHHSVMSKMWKAVLLTAKRLNVQVFASTHSLDCLRSFAALYKEDNSVENDIRLYRIEEEQAVPYSASEIHIAARQHMELRG